MSALKNLSSSLSNTYNKWKSGYYSTGYKSNYKQSTVASNSSFWLDESFTPNKIDSSGAAIRGLDVVALAGYKRAIGNFVRIVTNRSDIKVEYSTKDTSYTDGQTVTISCKLNTNEFDSTVGLALHEASHIALTDFKLLADKFQNKDAVNHQVLFDLTNIIEDRRIDRHIYDSAPGYTGYYHSLYEKYFNDKSIDEALISNRKCEATIENYLFHICNFTNANRNLNALPNLKAIWNLISIPTIGRLKSTAEVYDIAVKVLAIIIDSCDPVKTPRRKEPKEPQPGGAKVNPGNFKVNPKELTPKQEQALKDAIEAQADFVKGKIQKKQVTGKDFKKIKAVESANVTMDDVVYRNKNVAVTVIKGLTRSLLEAGVIPEHTYYCPGSETRVRRSTYQERESVAIEEGIQLGIQLGKRLKTRDEDRSINTTRLDSGRIDKRLLAELGFGNDAVFHQVLHNKSTPALIHISIDASGSMSGRQFCSAMKTAVAIAKAGTMVNSLQCAISIRGSRYSGTDVQPLVWIVYDSRVDKFNNVKHLFQYLRAAGSTPEGLCMPAIMKNILKNVDTNCDLYYINLCDGEPGFCSKTVTYGGREGIKHTKLQVDKMIHNGIKVLSFFIGGTQHASSIANHKDMYGAGTAVQIDTNQLAGLAKVLNKLFIRN